MVILIKCYVSEAFSSLAEEDIKISFIFKFVEFIDNTWPENDPDHISICIFGDFNSDLEKSYLKFSNQQILNKISKIIINPGDEDNHQCHVFYFSKYANDYRKHLSSCERIDAIFIGDLPYFNHYGGMIEFYSYRSQVKFRINSQAVDKSNIRFNAKLLEMGE